MKTKKLIESKLTVFEISPLIPSKPRSLRPMRSLVAVRSLKSRTSVAKIAAKQEESQSSR